MERIGSRKLLALGSLLALMPLNYAVSEPTCSGTEVEIGTKKQTGRILEDGTIAVRARMRSNGDSMENAYHENNIVGGAILHICNAGEVFLPNGTSYHGSVSNEVCTNTFTSDLRRIRDAGWSDPTVGVIRWYGIMGTSSVRMPVGNQGKTRIVDGVVPVKQNNGSGFYVSPTSLADSRITDLSNQRRYIDAQSVPAAVIPRSELLRQRGVMMGTLGVAINVKRAGAAPVPFIVGDGGPKIGEGSFALVREVAGLPVRPVTRNERFAGNVDTPDILWVFFGGTGISPPFDRVNVQGKAEQAFRAWGGPSRLSACSR
jgi:Fungal chitosanase of glycosyl hydrolase group 75